MRRWQQYWRWRRRRCYRNINWLSGADSNCRIYATTRDLTFAQRLESIQITETSAVGKLHASTFQDVEIVSLESRQARAGILGHVALTGWHESDGRDLSRLNLAVVGHHVDIAVQIKTDGVASTIRRGSGGTVGIFRRWGCCFRLFPSVLFLLFLRFHLLGSWPDENLGISYSIETIFCFILHIIVRRRRRR